MATQMQSWQLSAPGDFQAQLQLRTVSSPLPEQLKPTQILVKVRCAAINPADYKFPEMGLVAIMILKFPKTPGLDVSGEILAIGKSVVDVAVGDHIMGRLHPQKAEGALSEYVVMQKDCYAKISADVRFDVAAATVTAGLTAYQTIRPYVQPGARIFINGGSGGTGTYGIQIAKILRCHVTVSCSTAKVQLCKDLGADEIIDYTTCDVVEQLRTRGRIFKLAVDNIGNSRLHSNAKTFLQPGGIFLMVGHGMSVGELFTLARAFLWPSSYGGAAYTTIAYMTKTDYMDLRDLAQWVNEGKIMSVIEKVYPFEDVKTAYEQLKKKSTRGKIVVRVK